MENKNIIDLLKNIELSKQSGNKGMPENVQFLDSATILCGDRKNGDSRYPYSHDGYTLWAYSSGYIIIGESTFYVIPPAEEGKEPNLAFFGGIKNGQEYMPISITGVAKQYKEQVERFTVYTPKVFYYIARTAQVDFVLRGYVNGDKKTYFTQYAINKSNENKEIYLSSYFNCLLKYQPTEDFETKWFKSCKQNKQGFEFHSVVDIDRKTHLDHYAVIKRNLNQLNIKNISSTTSRYDFTSGRSNSISCSSALFNGKFEREKQACKFTETAVSGDIIELELSPKQVARVDYTLGVLSDNQSKDAYIAEDVASSDVVDQMINKAVKTEKDKFSADSMLKINFNDSQVENLNAKTFTDFTTSVIRQVEYCALAKNSGVSLLGIRDVFQQLEASLIWNREDSRNKIIEAISFMNLDGRLARQYSIPAKEGVIPQMDLRAFIDQGVWVINTIYQYLAYTGDYTLLDEVCGYYQFLTGNQVALTDKKSSVLQHMFDIMDFLKRNIDKQTNCLRALYGDWNDALDGLGVSQDNSAEFGSGVSVMATLQYYANLQEMTEILQQLGGFDSKIDEFKETREQLKAGLCDNAIVKNQNERKILHGWGDKKSYEVCGFNDVDNLSRDGLVVNAYWVISKAIDWDVSLKQDIMRCYHNLDSKYGLKTFEPYFARGVKGVGRIINLPKGTAENAAVYVHATMFGVWSLFMLNESKFAMDQLVKLLPITHKNISTSPFVMPNSYVYNEEFEMDGESMSDWFTGSSNVMIKTLVRYLFGIQPSLNSVVIEPSSYIPFKNCDISVKVKDTIIKLSYTNKSQGFRTFVVNGTKYENINKSAFDLLSITLEDELKLKNIEINIID